MTRSRLRICRLEDRTAPAAGALDPTFGVGGVVTTRFPLPSSDFGYAVAIDSFERIVVVGSTHNGSNNDFAITRYTPAGALDASFGDAGIVTIDFAASVDVAWGVAVDSQDRVVVVGYTGNNTGYDCGIVRLTAAGTLDSSFDGDGKQTIDFGGLSEVAEGVAFDSQGRIVIAGTGGSNFDFVVARLTAAGALDSSFDGDGKKTIAFGTSTEEAFGVAVDSQDRLVVAGYTYNGSDNDFAVARLTPTGELDSNFDGDGKKTIAFGATFNDDASGVAVDSQDRVVVAGYTNNGSSSDFAVARLTTAGALDSSFDGDGKLTIDFGALSDFAICVAVDSQDRVVVAGYTNNGSSSDFAVARLTAAGALDASFDGDGRQTIEFGSASGSAWGVTVNSQDRVVIAGGAGSDFAVARLIAAGTLDSSFDGDGKQTTDLRAASYATGRSVALDHMGRIVVGGYEGTDFAIARYTTTGTLDTSFGGSGLVTIDFASTDLAYSVAVDSLDRVVVAGYTGTSPNLNFAVIRLTSAGALDVTFDGDGKQTIDFDASTDLAYGVAVDSLDRVVVAGYTGTFPNYNFAVARLTAAGTLDSSFDGDGKQTIDFGASNDVAYGVAVDSLGRVVVAGRTGNASNFDFAVARLTAAGTLDSSFDGDGKQTIDFDSPNDQAYGVAVDSMGRVVLAGSTYNGSNADFAVARLTAAGTLDGGFDNDGKQIIDFGASDDSANGVAVDSLNRVVLAGSTATGQNNDFAVARITVAGALDSSFDGDGKRIIAFGPFNDTAYGVAVDSADRAVVAGVSLVNGNRFAITRLTGDTLTASVQVNNGSVQRSRVTSLTIHISEAATFAGAAANAFTLVRTGGGAVNFTANVSVEYGGTVVVLSNFTGPETEFGSLRDGRYTLTALESQISSNGQALDGDGTPGGDLVFGDAQGLFRFYGDMNGDRRIDISDFGFFSLAYLTPANYNAALDFNNDGRIDIADFGQFSVRFFTNLP